MMKKILLAGFTAVLAVFGMGGIASATTIDFSTIAPGPVSSIDEASFSLAGTGEQGTPFTSVYDGEGYLWNSPNSNLYPSNTILRVDFTTVVTDLEIDFNNFGARVTTWSLFDGAGSTLSTGTIIGDGSIHPYDFTSISNIATVEFTNLHPNYVFGISEIRYETEPVPEPASILLFGTGMAGLAGSRIRRKKKEECDNQLRSAIATKNRSTML